MKLRSVVALAAIPLVIAGLAACSSPADTGGEADDTLVAGLAVTVANIDEVNPGASFGSWLNALSAEPLFLRGENGTFTPWLAESFEQPSGTEYIYHLRPDVKFWDGATLTSDDVVASWTRAAADGSGWSANYATVDTIEAIDPATVKVTLTQPDPRWQWTVASYMGVVYQKAFLEENTDTHGQPGTLIMGTGPWVIDSLDPTGGAEFTANPDWWGGEVPFEHVSIKFFTDDNAIALAIRSGEIDVAPIVQDLASFQAASGVDVQSAPTCHQALLSMPTQVAPFDDVHVRQAIALALGREDIIAASGFSANPSYSLIAKSQLLSMGVSEGDVEALLAEVSVPEQDLEAAKAELAKSAYPDGFSATLTTFDYGGFLAVDQVIKAQLAEIGIEIQIDDVGQSAWFGAIVGPLLDRPLTYTTVGNCDPDPSFYNDWLGTGGLAEGGLNIAAWEAPGVEELITAGMTETDPQARLETYGELLAELQAQVPYIPLLMADSSYAAPGYDWQGRDIGWANDPWPLDLIPQ